MGSEANNRRGDKRGLARWQDWPLRAKGMALIAVPLAALLLTVAVALGTQTWQGRAERLVKLELELLASVARTHGLLSEAATGTRGFLLTGDAVFLAPFEQARRELGGELELLRSLSAQDALQEAGALRTTALAQRHLAELEALRLAPGPDLGTALVTNKVTLDALRAELAAQTTTTEARLATHRSRLRGAESWQTALTLFSVLFGILGGLGATRLFTGSVVRRLERLEHNAQRLAVGAALRPPLPGRDEIGRLGTAMRLASDLLQRRERELRESEQRLRSVISSAGLVLFSFDDQGVFTFAEGRALETLGLRPEALVGRSASDVFDSEVVTSAVQRALAGERFSTEIAVQGLVFEVRYTPQRQAGALTGVIGVASDITERKEAERQLEAQRLFYERILNRLPGDIATFDPAHRYLFVNLAAVHNDEVRAWMLGKDDFEYCRYRGLDESIAEKRRERFERAAASREPVRWEESVTLADGTTRHHVRIFAPVFDAAGALELMIGYGVDISARRRAELELLEAKTFTDTIIANLPGAFALYDARGQALRSNLAFAEVTGYSQEELAALAPVGYFGEDRPRVEAAFCEVLDQGAATVEAEIVCKDGSALPFFFSGARVMVRGAPHVMVVGIDISARKAVEAELQTQRDFAAQVMATVGQGLAVTGSDQRFSYVNPALAELLGYPPEALVGRTPLELVAPETRETMVQALQTRWQGKASSYEARLLRQDGAAVPVLITGVPRFENGRVVGSVSVVTDLRERLQAEARLLEQQRALEGAVEKFKRLARFRQALVELFDELLGERASDDAGEDFYGCLLDRAVAVIPGAEAGSILIKEASGLFRFVAAVGFDLEGLKPVPIGEDELVPPSGSVRPYIAHHFKTEESLDADKRAALDKSGRVGEIKAILAAPVVIDGRWVAVINLDNFSDSEAFGDEAVDMIAAFAGQAALMLRRLTLEAALKRQNRELELANQLKKEFLANMSHELRTPLTAIIGFSELLGEELFGPLNAKQSQYVSDIFEAGKHLLELINDILDLSKIEAGKMELNAEAVDLAELISSAFTIVKERAHKASIVLRAEVAVTKPLLADARKVKQVLYNLLSNAVKFTPAGGSVTVTAEEGASEVRVEVKDTGIGVALEDQDKLFKEFSQIDSTMARVHQGSGLGLALTRGLVNLHGGQVWVRSVPGEGSVFGFSLPRQLAGERAAPAVVLPAPDAGGAYTAKDATAKDATAKDATAKDATAKDATEENAPQKNAPADAADDAALPLLPLRQAPSSLPSPPSGAAPGETSDAGSWQGERNWVLVVDDDERSAALLCDYLEQAGYAARSVASGEAALELLRRARPAAITLDLLLPGIDGWSLLEALAADARLCRVPVIVVSVLGETKRGYALGAAAVLGKPVERAALIKALQGALEKTEARRVLVVDDDPAVLRLARDTLEALGFEVVAVASGEEALRHCARVRPDLVVLDLFLPGMSGFEVAEALKHQAEFADLPIIVLTAARIGDAERARLSGLVSAVAEKSPFDPELLRRELTRVTAKAGAQTPDGSS